MNAIEVEYKFKISHSQYTALMNTLDRVCTKCSKIKIYDEYFNFSHPSSQHLDIRLRQLHIVSEHNTLSTPTCYVTYKNKVQKKNNVHDDESTHPLLKGEINEEYETKVENYQVMKDLFLLLQGRLIIVKEKAGYTYTVPMTNSTVYKKYMEDLSLFKEYNIIVELLELTSLGYFLEIEVLLPENTMSSHIEPMQKMLLEFVTHMGIDTHTQIEPKLYTELLREK